MLRARAWIASLERYFPFAYPYRYVACCHKGVFPEGLSRTVSRPNGGSCASRGINTSRRCPKRKATPQIETGRVL
jgi:hypothetical protein